jgi:YHS domain-containing protein
VGLRAGIPLSGVLFVAFLAGRSMADDRVVPPVAAVNTTNGIALKGYDPVAYFTTGKPTPGTAEFSYSWSGVTYRFASATNLHLFAADPEKYTPQYGGYCAYAISINRIADIDPSEWAIVDHKLYLNNNTFSQALWSLNKHGRIVSGDRNWAAFPKTGTDSPAKETSVP